MKIAVMQPYFMPYVGYFQLIQAVDNFVFYDDVGFIKKGWINRNQILIRNASHLFTIPLVKSTQNKLINEIFISSFQTWKQSFLKTIESNYKKAPYFESTFSLLNDLLDTEYEKISDLAIESTIQIAKYLDLRTKFEISSEKYSQSKGLDRQKRLIAICESARAKTYINMIGGIELYNKVDFSENGIELLFLRGEIEEYSQFKHDFIPGLSMIDLLMFNDREDIKKMLQKYSLV